MRTMYWHVSTTSYDALPSLPPDPDSKDIAARANLETIVEAMVEAMAKVMAQA